MSSALYRMGRLAARHPWSVIGVVGVVAAVAVVVASTAFGRDLEDTLRRAGPRLAAGRRAAVGGRSPTRPE